MTKYYISTYYINMYLSKEQSMPPAMVHIVLYIGAVEEERMFYALEEKTKKFLKKFQNIRLNEDIEFAQKEITLENMGEFFYHKLAELLSKQGVQLYQLEIYTTPARRYKVSNRLLLPFQYPADVEKWIEHIQEWMQRLNSAGKEETHETQQKKAEKSSNYDTKYCN